MRAALSAGETMRARQRLLQVFQQWQRWGRGAARRTAGAIGPACRRLADRLAYRPREVVVVGLLAGGLCGGLGVERWRVRYPVTAERLEAEPPRLASTATAPPTPRPRPRQAVLRCEAPEERARPGAGVAASIDLGAPARSEPRDPGRARAPRGHQLGPGGADRRGARRLRARGPRRRDRPTVARALREVPARRAPGPARRVGTLFNERPRPRAPRRIVGRPCPVTAPLLPLAVAFAVGAWLGLAVEPPAWVVVAGIVGGGLLIPLARGYSPAGASVGVLVLCVLAGWARVALPDPFPPLRGVSPGPAILEGLVGGVPEIEGSRMRVPLVLRRAGVDPPRAAAGVLFLSIYGPHPPLAAGDHVRVTGEVRRLEPFRNPGAAPTGTGPRTPRYVLTARAEGVERLAGFPVPWWLRTRLWIHGVIDTHLPPVSGALLEGLLIGERRQLPPTLLADFRRAGVYHVLAISGFNVALVAGSAFLLLRLARVPASVAAVLALATLGAFAAVVGGQPSVLRATIMGGLLLAAGLLGRESRVWNSLGAALLALLALDPGSLAEAGLQLSFAATAGLLHLGPWIRAALPSWCPGPIKSALAVSAGAQLGVTPVMLVHFGQLSPLGVVANLVVVPLAGLLTIGGVLTLAVATLHEPLAHLLFQSLWLLLVTLRVVVRAFAALPGAVMYLPPPPALARGRERARPGPRSVGARAHGAPGRRRARPRRDRRHDRRAPVGRAGAGDRARRGAGRGDPRARPGRPGAPRGHRRRRPGTWRPRRARRRPDPAPARPPAPDRPRAHSRRPRSSGRPGRAPRGHPRRRGLDPGGERGRRVAHAGHGAGDPGRFPRPRRPAVARPPPGDGAPPAPGAARVRRPASGAARSPSRVGPVRGDPDRRRGAGRRDCRRAGPGSRSAQRF